MQNQEDILKHIQKLFDENPESINIIEEEIDLDIQMAYLRRSNKLHKQKVEVQQILSKVPDLYNDNVRFEEKRDILIQLARFDEVEAFRAVEAYWKEAKDDMKPWASMAYRDSKMTLESSLLNQKQFLISTGLGGKGHKIRFFIALVHKDKKPFIDTQQTLIKKELEYSIQKVDGVCENVTFENELVKVIALIPLNVPIKEIVKSAVLECNQYGDFLSEDFVVTNIKKLDNKEIYKIIKARSDEKFLSDFDIENFDDFDDFDDFDYDEDEDEDDDD